jgi:hypothetical protein
MAERFTIVRQGDANEGLKDGKVLHVDSLVLTPDMIALLEDILEQMLLLLDGVSDNDGF